MTDHLPPGPYKFMSTAAMDMPLGNGHVYLIDRNGRKIAALWGRPEEKLALAELIIKASLTFESEFDQARKVLLADIAKLTGDAMTDEYTVILSRAEIDTLTHALAEQMLQLMRDGDSMENLKAFCARIDQLENMK